MATEPSQLAGFLSDLTLIGCGAGVALYGAWAATHAQTLLRLGRLSLVAAFGASVLGFAALPPGTLPGYPAFLAFLLLAQFLLVEFVFQVSVLGLFVSLAGALLAGWAYWSPPFSAPSASLLAGYWWAIRDLAMAVGGAVGVLGLTAGLLLHVLRDRRLGGLVHTNDLRDMAAVWALVPAPTLTFALAAALVGLSRPGAFTFGEALRAGLIAHALVASLAWLVVAQSRRFRTRRSLLVMAWALLAIGAYAASFLASMGLTGAPSIP